jgi:addiction module HigA family antidote
MIIRRTDLESGSIDLADVIDAKAGRIAPLHPGAVLREEFLEPLDITAYRLAKDIGVPLTRIAAILAGKRAITAETALRLGRYFRMSPEFWLGLQEQFDLDLARAQLGDRLVKEVAVREAQVA